MSLSAHLRSPSSQVRAWFEDHFPRTQQVSTAANCLLRDGRATCDLEPLPRSDSGLVGTAVDLALRAHLRERALERTVATKVGWMSQEAALKAFEIERHAVATVESLHPWERDLDDAEWRALCFACAAVARLEQCYRATTVRLFVDQILRLRPEIKDSAAFIEATTSDEVLDDSVQDLHALARAAVADNLDLRQVTPLHLNPDFEQSKALGGADADVIAGSTLLDWKTAASRPTGRHDLWQLVGYALADTPNAYGIDTVGISAVRWRRRVCWPLADLLADLSGGRARDVARLRVQFAELLRPRGPAGT